MNMALIIGKDDNGLHLEGEYDLRQEAVTRTMTSILSGDEDVAPPTYTDDLVTGRYYNKDEPSHLREVAYGDPMGNIITVGVAENALGDGWRYVKNIGDNEEVPEAKAIHEDFAQCHARYWLTRALIAERIFGSALLYTGSKQFRTDIFGDEREANALDVFTPEYYEFPTEHLDDMGRPTKVKITPNPEDKNREVLIDYDDFIHIFTRPKGRSYEGYSSLYNVWSYITLIRHSTYNLGWALQKFGTGAMIVYLSGRLTPSAETSIQTMIQKFSQQRAGIADANLIDRIEYVGPSGGFSNNIPECIDTFVSFVAAGARMPKSILTGDSSGVIASGEVEDKHYYAGISKVQQSMTKYIKELARRRGHPINWHIEFNAVYAKDEREAAEIRVLEADALLKEKQAERGDLMVSFQGPKEEGPKEEDSMKDRDKNNNPAGVR